MKSGAHSVMVPLRHGEWLIASASGVIITVIVMGTEQIGRVMLVLALVLAVTGLGMLAASALGLGRLPGDLSFGRGGARVYVLLGTSVVLSVVATLVLNLMLRR